MGTSITKNFQSVASATLDRYVTDNFVDQITDEFPTLWWLMGTNKGQKPNLPRHRVGKKSKAGGDTIRGHVSFKLNTTTRRLATQYQTISLEPQENETIWQLEWRQIAGSVSVASLEIQKNQASDARLIEIVGERVANTQRSVRDLLSTDIFSDGSVDGSIVGLQSAVDSTGTYALINRATDTWWAAQEAAAHGAFDADTLDEMTDQVVAATIGTDSPDLIVSTALIWRQYMDLVDDAKRFTTDRADARFRFLDFQGIPFIFDRDVATGEMFILNSNHTYWCAMKGAEAQATPFERATVNGQLAEVALVHMTGQLVVDEPRKNAKIPGIT